MNCQDALRLLYDIIDKEASQVDTERVQEHLSKCRKCFEVYQLEGHIQEFICAKVGSNTDPTPKLESLKARISTRLDSVDAEKKTLRTTPAFKRLSFGVALAASVILVVFAGFYGVRLYNHQKAYIPLEEVHWSATEDLDTWSSFGNTEATLALASTTMDHPLASEVSDFRLEGGRMTEVEGIDIAHFVYTNQDQKISVFVAPAGDFQIPEDLVKSGVKRGNITFYDHNCRGCRLVYHRVGNAVVVTATTERHIELLDFLPEDGAI
jgi:anti-sigma factor (TIGR02949 family)